MRSDSVTSQICRRLHSAARLDFTRKLMTSYFRSGKIDSCFEARCAMDIDRRQFFRACAAGLSGSSLALLGFSPQPVLAETRAFKLARTTETRNTCPYCSVGCGVIMYSLGDKAKNAKSEVVHIEGDSDHPVNRGTLCPKGAGLLDFVRSKNRLRYPEHRAPGAAE